MTRAGAWNSALLVLRTNSVAATYVLNFRIQEDAHAGGAAFLFQHSQDVAGGTIAEQLSERLFVIRNAMLLDERDEIRGGIASQQGLREMRVPGKIILGLAAEVGEIAAAATGDENFFAKPVGVVEDDNAASALAGFDGALEPCRPGAQNDGVKFLIHFGRS